MSTKKELSTLEIENLIQILYDRFHKHSKRHPNLLWENILLKLQENTEKLWILNQMEHSGGEPDVIEYDEKSDEYLFYDCSAESPKDRRSLCYDRESLDSRKENKPANNVLDVAQEMGIELLNEYQYRKLQTVGNFDLKTSSWLKTPPEIRKLGGAIFADYRYGQVFVYHNGASSYYAARGFRGLVRV